MTMEKILVLGFGRMGLSHASLYNLLFDSAPRKVCVFDPSRKLSLALRMTRKFHRIEPITKADFEKINEYESIFVCSPPLLHGTNLRDISGYKGKIFVEKPGFFDYTDIAGIDAEKIYVGYVLLHSSAIRRVLAYADGREFRSLSLTLVTNAGFGDDHGNWRDAPGHGGGLVNEFGSHCVNLLLHLVKRPLTLENVKWLGPNEVRLYLADPAAGDNGAQFSISLKAAQSSVRKAVYTVSGAFSDGTNIWTDLSSIRINSSAGGGRDATEVTSLADGQLNSPAYLRGHEFSNQMTHFINGENFGDSVGLSIRTDEILREIHDIIDARR